MTGSYRFAIDRGGTFTDVVAETPEGRLVTAKLLSDNPDHYEDAASAAVRRIVSEHGEAPIAEVRIGTTIATNALLERRGEPLVLAITAGFADALGIGTQARPEIFARHIVLPEQLPAEVIEIEERVAVNSEVLRPLGEEQARAALVSARERGFQSIAIVLLHGWRHTAHEKRLAELAHEAGFAQVSVSHEVAPLVRLVPRGDTTVVDAYLSPVIRHYVGQLSSALPAHASLRFMQSNGGLADARAFRGKDAILSGPAGGVVGMVASAPGHERLIGFDMGGTSTDVAHYAGEYELTGDRAVAGVRVTAPMMQIHTIAAGGGSICRLDNGRFQVGPGSAGADPGPACYRKGGPLTVTDCNLFLGRIDPGFFPAVFGPEGNQPLDRDASRARLEGVAAELAEPMALAAIAEGFLTIAVDAMANAIRKISTARGRDVTRYALACFGGAGGQHACRVADNLGIEAVLVHPLAGMLSAYGIGLAPVKAIREASLVQPLGEPFGDALAALEDAAVGALVEQGIVRERISLVRRARLRFAGSDTALTLAVQDAAEMAQSFRGQHSTRFGYSDDAAEIVLEGLAVEASGTSGGLWEASVDFDRLPTGKTTGDWPTVPRGALSNGESLAGPALVIDPGSTTVVEPGWSARLDDAGSLVLSRDTAFERPTAAGTEADPVRLEIFNNLFMAIAEEMGVVLEATASSVNIKERLDFSCALFDAEGALIANAPHIPVHLGSMGESVRHIIEARGGSRDGRGIRPADAYALNDPYHGGTHLPDVTVIVPVFYGDRQMEEPDAFVAARGHHADVGGTAPGSMPPDSTSIEQEGVLIDNFLLVDEGRFREAEMRGLLRSGKYPARSPDRNIADLKAQLAACSRGGELLRQSAGEHGRDVVASYMDHVLANAEEAVRRLLGRLEDGAFEYPMDNGAVVKVALRIDHENRSAVFDFTGTSAQLPDNFNAPRSITRAAALYALRTLIDDPMPLNDGCLRPVGVVVPPGSMLDPAPGAAVVAGNVETSQVVTDAILAATGMLAPSQGTMNNFTFGDSTQQYYETIAGGSGAGPDHDGTSAVQTHMTNSRLTDPEILEMRFPVRVDRFAIRQGSGGAGRHRGGDGVERRITFLEPMRANVLANRRKIAPRGLAGGSDAAAGENWVERADSTIHSLAATGSAEMRPGDTFVIRTPGGGGFGPED